MLNFTDKKVTLIPPQEKLAATKEWLKSHGQKFTSSQGVITLIDPQPGLVSALVQRYLDKITSTPAPTPAPTPHQPKRGEPGYGQYLQKVTRSLERKPFFVLAKIALAYGLEPITERLSHKAAVTRVYRAVADNPEVYFRIIKK